MYRRAEKETKHDLSTVLVFASDDINEKKLKSLQNDVKQKFIYFLDWFLIEISSARNMKLIHLESALT